MEGEHGAGLEEVWWSEPHALAARLATISFSLGLAGLIAAEFIARRLQRMLGR